MSIETIPKKKIDELGVKLSTIISEKKELLSNIEANIEFGITLVSQMETLRSIIGRAKVKMNEEKKEIKEMEIKHSKINKLNEISPKSTSYEEEIIMFAECDSVVENQLNIINKDSIENINRALKYLLIRYVA
jgi:hypothetical protein